MSTKYKTISVNKNSNVKYPVTLTKNRRQLHHKEEKDKTTTQEIDLKLN
jgi:hypothetical protein